MSSATEQAGAIVIGVGNAWGGDDAAGLRVVEAARERLPAGVATAVHEGEPTALLDLWDGIGTAIVIDAVAGGGPAGSVRVWDATSEPLPSSFTGGSTHAFSVAQAIELGRTLNRLPQRMVVIGVEGHSFDSGTELSPPVGEAIEQAVVTVLGQLGGE